MDQDLYDEFGNYIGPNIESDYEDEIEATDQAVDSEPAATNGGTDDVLVEKYPKSEARVVVYHEDKKYYPDAAQIYGPNVETVVQDEDLQPLTEPIIAPVRKLKFSHITNAVPETVYDQRYMLGLLKVPELIRNVALCGHLHHGKTTFCDAIFEQTHPGLGSSEERELLFTDHLFTEQERGLSIKRPASLRRLEYVLNGPARRNACVPLINSHFYLVASQRE
ncbi:hypothetical protein ACOME3_010019 [Neoechinorhynchus agilis]